MTRMRILLAGSFAPAALERSYAAAFHDLGYQLLQFDIVTVINRYCRLGRLGQFINTFLPVEPWIRKANRELVVASQKFRPDVLIVFGQNRVQAGALAQVKSMFPIKLVYIWQDTLINLNEASIMTLPLYDLVAVYGCGTINQFKYLGARRVEWVPLAGDPHMAMNIHPYAQIEQDEFEADISFIVQWRPEREAVMQVVLDNFKDKSIKIWGPDWGRRARGKETILKAWQGRSLYEKEYHQVLASSGISLNIIDDTNYPAANMRFFEIPMAGGVQVSSPCPEMEGIFKHGETAFYFHKVEELCGLIRILTDDAELRRRVAKKAHEAILASHTYAHRARQILQFLE